MSEFQMPFKWDVAVTRFYQLPPFIQGYIEALFFTESGEEGRPLEGLAFDDIPHETMEMIRRDCEEFQKEASLLLLSAYARDYEPVQAGRDFWFTRNGHGAGFWDREVLAHNELGDLLSTVATDQGAVDPYKGDDGLIYLS